jgi:hypothetical protein
LRWRRSGCGGLRSVAAKRGSLRWIRRGCGGALYVALGKAGLRPISLRCGGSRAVAVRLALYRNVGIRCGGDGGIAVEPLLHRAGGGVAVERVRLRWRQGRCGGSAHSPLDQPAPEGWNLSSLGREPQVWRSSHQFWSPEGAAHNAAEGVTPSGFRSVSGLVPGAYAPG